MIEPSWTVYSYYIMFFHSIIQHVWSHDGPSWSHNVGRARTILNIQLFILLKIKDYNFIYGLWD